ncbi:calcium/sodium antiporter [Marinicella gelatinilytica]|uniref:calcium/sodium antiporter n=1 Tax=Marinicella gelatinilytica TaxID=2996017 RepID=UPI002260CBA9|nr:calcium/sodium antiporter [Marinicella gelatinilytica]MCX7544603.1 calcium/sodium antiporter [Marinicella gelatinilytica]
MLIPSGYLVIGLILLIFAADKFIIGAAALAKHLGVSTMLVGLIVVGFGTSAPEMVVSAIASFKGNSGLAMGNAVGSNITNIALVLGVGLLITPMQVKSKIIKREMPILLMVCLLALFLLLDLSLTFVDGVILLISMLAVTLLLGFLGVTESKDSYSDEVESEYDLSIKMSHAVLFLLFGIIVLPLASQLMVVGATDIAQYFGVSDLVIGLTVVALGTSLPELAAIIASAAKKEHDLAIGNIVGSNIFNLLGVIGISGVINDYEFSRRFLMFDYLYMVILTVFLFIVSIYFVLKDRFVSRLIGVILVLLYVSYMIWLFVSKAS